MTATVVRDRDRRQLMIERMARGSVDLVWACWTEPHHLRKWWGPEGWRCDVFELQLRPGGTWKYRLRPDGEHTIDDEYWGQATYLEVHPPRHLVFDDVAYTPGFGEATAAATPTSVVIEPLTDETSDHVGRPSGCRITIMVQFVSVEDLDQAEAIGMVTGFTEALTRLDQHLTRIHRRDAS